MPTTAFTGPLGSTIHSIHADAETIKRLAMLDWSRQFRRVTLDPVRGLISLMSPSGLHESMADTLDKIVEKATELIGSESTGLRSTRFRRKDDPPGTGLEPDCSFLIGDKARNYVAALKRGEADAEAYLLETAPDLVVEVELTHAEAGKAERYGQLGVCEIWLLKANRKREIVGAEFLVLHPSNAPEATPASHVLPGIRPEEVVAAIKGVRLALTREARSTAVERVIGKRGVARVQEEAAAYS